MWRFFRGFQAVVPIHPQLNANCPQNDKARRNDMIAAGLIGFRTSRQP
jgi:hypothetical protein